MAWIRSDGAISETDCAAFARDGFLIRERIVGIETVTRLREAMAQSFEGGYETRGIYAGGIGFFAPEAEDVVAEAIRQLAEEAGRTIPDN